MKMRVMLTALLGGLALLVAAGSNNAAVAEDPDISTIMKKVNSGKTALKATMKAGLTAKQPDWDVLKTSAEQLTELAVALGKNKQPKGPDESWKKLTGLYAENAKALEAAIGKKDAKASNAAYAKFFAGSTCGACHKVHQD